MRSVHKTEFLGCAACMARLSPYIVHGTMSGPPLFAYRSRRNGRKLAAKGTLGRIVPMSTTTHAKVVIIGSGPAGYAAAVYAAGGVKALADLSATRPGARKLLAQMSSR